MHIQVYLLFLYILIYMYSLVMDITALIKIYGLKSYKEVVIISFNILLTIMYIIMTLLLIAAYLSKINDTVQYIKYAIIIFNTSNILYISRLTTTVKYIKFVMKNK